MDRPCTTCCQTLKGNASLRAHNRRFKEAEENKISQEENKISQPCLNIELNNEDKNNEEMENEDISSFESNKRDDKSTEGLGIPETCVDFEQSSNIGLNIGNENVLLSY